MNNTFLTLFVAHIMSASHHPDVGKIINHYVKQIETAVLNLHVLRDRMTPFTQIAGPEFGLFEYLCVAGLLRTADDLTATVTDIREQRAILGDLLSAEQKDNILKLMVELVDEVKELALVETPLRRNAHEFENRKTHYTYPK